MVVSFGLERLEAARSASVSLQKQIRMLAQGSPSESQLLARRDSLQATLSSVKSRFYRADEMSPYAFGDLIKQKLAGLGIDIARYQVVDAKGRSYLEFTAGGSALAVARFVRSAFESGKYWSIPSLTIKSRGGEGTVDVVFQIGYEILVDENR